MWGNCDQAKMDRFVNSDNSQGNTMQSYILYINKQGLHFCAVTFLKAHDSS